MLFGLRASWLLQLRGKALLSRGIGTMLQHVLVLLGLSSALLCSSAVTELLWGFCVACVLHADLHISPMQTIVSADTDMVPG